MSIRLLTRLLPALVALMLALPAGAEEPGQQEQAKVNVTVDVLPAGDGAAEVVLDFAPLTYQFVKQVIPDPGRILKELALRRGNLEVGPGTQARYDDTTTSARLTLNLVGLARNDGQGRWEVPVDPAYEFISDKVEGDRPLFVYYQFGEYRRHYFNSMPFRGQFRYRLPAGAKQATWDGDKHVIRYQLATPEGTGPASLATELTVKPRLMSAIYKCYGREDTLAHMWVAKARLTNSGTSTLRDVRVRFRVEGYSEWSPWQRYPELVPGQTAVARYHPVLDAKIARLQSATPANVLVEWTSTDLQGKVQSDSEGRKVTLLGGHDMVFSDLKEAERGARNVDNDTYGPFAAAWVTPDDLVVKEFAAMASRGAGGEGSRRGDESTLLVLNAIYDLWVANGFTYQHPPGLVDTSISFDPQLIQNVKFPRDVLRDKGGTCIDVAICFAAIANALGIRPFLALVPGHCFPVFELPSGGLVGFEATGPLKGGVRQMPGEEQEAQVGVVRAFKDCLQMGSAQLRHFRGRDQIQLIDVQELWSRGVASPDLDPLPVTVLKDWGLKAATREEQPAAQPEQPATEQPAEEPAEQPAAEEADPYIGRWTMNLREQIPGTGQVITYPVVLTIAADGDGYKAGTEAQAQIPTPNGLVTFRVIQILKGARSEDGALVLKGTEKVIQNVSTGQSSRMAVDSMVAIVRGGLLIGKGTADGVTWTEFQMQPAR